MTRLRVNDKEEIKELNKRLNECKKENEMLKKQFGSSLSNLDFKGFTPRQQAIIEYIKNKPASSKEEVIKELTNTSKGSRNTIVKDIDILIKEFNAIIPRKDKPNSMIYKLYINNDSELLSLYQDLNQIKDLFFILIDKIKQDPLKYNSENKFNTPIIDSIILIYIHILGIYITNSFLKWTKEIEDNNLINKLYTLLFSNLIEIQKEISKSFKIKINIPFKKSTASQIRSMLYTNLIHRFFILDQKQILQVLQEFNKYENINEIHDLLKLVWKISFPIYRYSNIGILATSPHNVYDLEDLGLAMKYYLNQNKIENNSNIQKILRNLENR